MRSFNLIGKKLGENGRYYVEALIGEGGMGKVYKAVDAKMSIGSIRVYKAIKLLSPEFAKNELVKKRFEREMQASLVIQDTRIVQVSDYGIVRNKSKDKDLCWDLPFIVMEYIDSPTLAKLLDQNTKLQILQSVQIVSQIASALQVLHTGIEIRGELIKFIHRDLKPANIFVIANTLGEQSIKLGDFGIVKFVGNITLQTLTSHGAAIGTLSYMSPEQLKDSTTIDERSDIYSLGCILYEMVSGTDPYQLPQKSGCFDWIKAILNQPPCPFPAALNIPKPLVKVIWKCLEKDPDKRFTSVQEFYEALKTLESSLRSKPFPFFGNFFRKLIF